jgi:hypothetical protein
MSYVSNPNNTTIGYCVSDTQLVITMGGGVCVSVK